MPASIDGRIIDMHSHFFPLRMFESIWEYFTTRNWSIRYQDTPDALAQNLLEMGVSRFVTYNYAHKPGVAAGLNEWTARFAELHPEAIPFATVFPADEDNRGMLDELLGRKGFRGIKIQPLVSDFYAWDERMDEVYECLLEHDAILTIHAGTAPIANEYVGADHFEPVMEKYPELKVVVAHMGAFEFERFFDIVREYPNVYLDTSVNFIDPELMRSLVERREFPPLQVPAEFDRGVLRELSDRLLFGSDYPNIPYTYEDCIRSILRLDMGDDFNRAVFFENALLLLGE